MANKNKNNTKQNIKLLDDDMTFKFIELYENEWQYRYSQFQDLFIKISIVTYILILFPYIPDAFNINISKYQLSIIIFPFIGIILSILELALLLSQNARLITISKKMRDLTTLINPQYKKYDYNILQKNVNGKTTIKVKFYKIRLGSYVAWVNFAVQLISSIFILYALITIEHVPIITP